MTWTYTDEYYRQYTRDTWNESAPEYGPILRNLSVFNPDLLAHAQPRPGERVLDVATGPGEPALTIAQVVGPAGSVLGIDLAERMVEIAQGNARALGLANASFKVMDAERLELPDASFDLAVSRFGIQIVTDPNRALAEMRRVLRPGGRIALTVWGLRERCHALEWIVGPMLEHAEPDETGYLPTPYEMGGEGELAEILETLGLRDVRETRVVREWTFPHADACLRGTLQGTPIGHSLREEPEDVQQAVLKKAKENLARWTRPDGSIAMPAECVVVSATR